MQEPAEISELHADVIDWVQSVREYLEYQGHCGTLGLPVEPRSGQGGAEPAVASNRLSTSSKPGESPLAAAPALDDQPQLMDPAPAEAKAMGKDCAQALVSLAVSVRGCTRCQLHVERTQTVFARGTGTSGLCFVGEGPGADEDAQGFPFVGKAGQLLDRMISAMGLMRDEVYVCNIVKCRPPNNRKPMPEEVSACRPFLERQLELLGPEVIVALGATAVEGLLGIADGITRLRGKWKLYRGTVPVMPTFHPAYLLRNPSAKHPVWEDMCEVLRQMGRQVPERTKA